MRVEPINKPTLQFRAYQINRNDNKHVKYLYNKMLDCLDNAGTLSTFTRDHITIESMTEDLKNKLNEYGIKYFKQEG